MRQELTRLRLMSQLKSFVGIPQKVLLRRRLLV
jgi:hypothetical protein